MSMSADQICDRFRHQTFAEWPRRWKRSEATEVRADDSYLYFQQTPNPNEYDEVMGITQVDSRETERFEEGLESEVHDVAEESPDILTSKPDSGRMLGFFPGGFGSSSLQECLNLLNQARRNSLATCHSRVEVDKPSDPLHSLSCSVSSTAGSFGHSHVWFAARSP